MPVVPFTHHHRRHTIPDHDHAQCVADTDRLADVAAQHNDESADGDQPVTVADLLDAIGINPKRPGFPLDFPDYYLKAADDVRLAFVHVAQVFTGHRRLSDLSPSERAEFDRRTT